MFTCLRAVKLTSRAGICPVRILPHETELGRGMLWKGYPDSRLGGQAASLNAVMAAVSGGSRRRRPCKPASLVPYHVDISFSLPWILHRWIAKQASTTYKVSATNCGISNCFHIAQIGAAQTPSRTRSGVQISCAACVSSVVGLLLDWQDDVRTAAREDRHPKRIGHTIPSTRSIVFDPLEHHRYGSASLVQVEADQELKIPEQVKQGAFFGSGLRKLKKMLEKFIPILLSRGRSRQSVFINCYATLDTQRSCCVIYMVDRTGLTSQTP